MKILIPSGIPFAIIAMWALLSKAGAEDFVDLDDLLEMDELLDDDGTVARGASAAIADPLKGLNQAIFGFNDAAYIKIFQPFTRQYVRVIPKEARKGVVNFFNNLEYPLRLVGSLLQFRFGLASQETGKFFINTTAGMAGFMNAARVFEGLQPPKEDIGQAFGAWGFKHGFYFVLPFLGPTSLRDFVGRIGGNYVDPISEPWTQVDDSTDRLILTAVDTVNDLPEIIDVYNSITGSAIDPYTAVRDAFAQLRAAQVAK